MYSFLADLVLIVHLAFVVFVLCGGLLVLMLRWLAWLHLPAALWGAIVEFTGWICPLTPLENWFREQDGETPYRSDIISQYLLPVLYPEDLTTRPSVGVRWRRGHPQCRRLLVALANAGAWCISESIRFSRAGKRDQPS